MVLYDSIRVLPYLMYWVMLKELVNSVVWPTLDIIYSASSDGSVRSFRPDGKLKMESSLKVCLVQLKVAIDLQFDATKLSSYCPNINTIPLLFDTIKLSTPEKSSQNAKEARASQTHVHTTGSTSYADKRADFVVLEGRQPSHLEFFTLTHTKVDGGFVDNTLSSQFLVEASTKVQELVSNSSSSKCQIEIENDVFDSLMYEEGQPKRPLGFRLRVKESDIFGVNVSFAKKKRFDSTSGMNNYVEMENMKTTIVNMKKENQAELASMKRENQAELASMKRENQELKARMDQNNQILLQALKAIHTGMVSTELLDAAESALRVADSQVASTSEDLEGFPTTNTMAAPKITDPAEIEKMIDSVIFANPKQVQQYRGGKTKLQGFFASQVMKESKGKANPGLLNKILLEKLNGKD